MNIISAEPRGRRERAIRIALLLAWALIAAWLAVGHVFWRDEVRAFTIALGGDNVLDMLRGLHGEGHPALWYLLLRFAHDVAPVRAVLPITAYLVAAAAMILLVRHSPFRPFVLGLILFSSMGLVEYAVSARNYGISMLVLFWVAWLYPRHRDRGVTIGLLLALLCNTNVPAALLAASFLLFWLVELISEDGLAWTPRLRLFLINAVIAALGASACFLLVYPPANDAAIASHPGLSATSLFEALVIPGAWFHDFAPKLVPWSTFMLIGLSLVIVGSLLGLARAPAALISAIVVAAGLELFFYLVYRGGFRHQALLIAYLVTMYWLVARGRGGRWPERWGPERWRIDAFAGPVARAGTWLFLILLAFQVSNAMVAVAAEAQGIPAGHARDLARLIARQRLGDAILVADPDVMLEAMPYYVDNPIYLLREQRFGKVVRFTRDARTALRLDDVLAAAEGLNARTRRPIVIVLQHKLDPAAPPATVSEGYLESFTTSPDQVRRFLAATRKIADYDQALSDESYAVYLLDRPPPTGAATVKPGSARSPGARAKP